MEGLVLTIRNSLGSVAAAQPIDQLHCELRDRESAALTPFVSPLSRIGKAHKASVKSNQASHF